MVTGLPHEKSRPPHPAPDTLPPSGKAAFSAHAAGRRHTIRPDAAAAGLFHL